MNAISVILVSITLLVLVLGYRVVNKRETAPTLQRGGRGSRERDGDEDEEPAPARRTVRR